MKTTFYKLRQPSEAKAIGVKDGGSQAEFIKDGFKNKSHYEEIMKFKDISNQANYGKFQTLKLT